MHSRHAQLTRCFSAVAELLVFPADFVQLSVGFWFFCYLGPVNCLFSVLGIFSCLLELSIPVQVVVWKNSSPKWPKCVERQQGRKTLLTYSLIALTTVWWWYQWQTIRSILTRDVSWVKTASKANVLGAVGRRRGVAGDVELDPAREWSIKVTWCKCSLQLRNELRPASTGQTRSITFTWTTHRYTNVIHHHVTAT